MVVPDNERCEACLFSNYKRYRCHNRSKYTVLMYSRLTDGYRGEPTGEPEEIRLCGTCKRKADKGSSVHIYVSEGESIFDGVETRIMYAEESLENRLKSQLWGTEQREKSARHRVNDKKRETAFSLLDLADETLELLYMVAERGDQRAWDIINTITGGKEAIEKAEQASIQAAADLADLQRQIEEAKRKE